MHRAAKYRRISDDREGRELGVTRQDEDLDALAIRNGLTVVATYSDNDIGASTRSRKRRPDYQRMISDAKAGQFEWIIAYTSSRLTRRPRENEDLIQLAEEHGIRFAYVRSPSIDLGTAAGRMIARMLVAADAAEAENISERVSREIIQRAQQGRHHGGPKAYGYSRDGLELVPEEAANLERWYRELLAGRSIASIAREAGRSHHGTRDLLLNERNAGLRHLRGVDYPGQWPPVIDEQTYRAAAALITDPDRATNAGKRARRWLGSGLYGCDRCDGLAVTSTWASNSVGGHRILKCKPEHGGCSRSWRAEPIDAFVVDMFEGRLARKDIADLLPRQQRPDLQKLYAERKTLRQKLDRLAGDWALDKLSDSQLAAATAAAQQRLAEIEPIIAAATGAGPLDELLNQPDPVAAWRKIPEDQVTRRQAAIRGLMTVRLGPSPRGRAKWDPTVIFANSTWAGDTKTWGSVWAANA